MSSVIIGFESDDALSLASALGLFFECSCDVEGQLRAMIFAIHREPHIAVLKGRRLPSLLSGIAFDDIGEEFLLVSSSCSLSMKRAENCIFSSVIRIRFFDDDCTAAERCIAILEQTPLRHLRLNEEATTLETVRHTLCSDVQLMNT